MGRAVPFLLIVNYEAYASKDGVLFSKDMKTLAVYPKGKSQTTYEVPSGVTTIGRFVFSDNEELADIYYLGTKDEWNDIIIGKYNTDMNNASIHYLTDVDPTDTPSETPSEIPTDKPIEPSTEPIIDKEAVTIEKQADSTYIFNIPLENVTEPCIMIAVIYDENGVVSGIEEVEVAAGDTEKTVNVTSENAENAKVFLWSDLLNMKPICSFAEKKIE